MKTSSPSYEVRWFRNQYGSLRLVAKYPYEWWWIDTRVKLGNYMDSIEEWFWN
jgi:hypothetical protein